MISTAVMVKLGHVYGNLMVNVQPTNRKLEDRARRIIQAATGVAYDRAAELLDRAGRSVRVAIVMQKKQITRAGGRERCWRGQGQNSGGFESLDKLVIEGGVPLAGEIAVSGAKNSALPALAACLLTAEPVMLDRIPSVRDIRTMEDLLAHVGRASQIEGDRVTVCAGRIEHPGSALRTGQDHARVEPGAGTAGRRAAGEPACRCREDARSARVRSICTSPGSSDLGAEVRQEHGYIEADAPHGLQGANVQFDRITVTGTEDLMMAAVLARGETVIENAAREPEVVDLADAA